jgi:16S rRNA A1518/A1519 N6-dimethyltransferase RsmA/KsgA/DIM1 with predicted DNA glycosylase/AP lyase activity
MELVILTGIVLILLFCGVVLFGAPYLPTLSKRVEDALNLMDLKPGQTMLELGSGDGRMLKAAAKRGLNAVGYELNPLLVVYSKINCWRFRKNVVIHWGNYWHKKWPPTDGIYVFLLQPYMEKLHNRLMQESKKSSIKLVSFAFKIEQKEDKKHKDGMYLYIYKT